MSQVSFSVADIAVEPYSVTPNLTVRLRVEEATGEPVHAVALRCQVRIEPQRRRYSEAEQEGLHDLFGPRDRWTSTLRPFLWLQCTTMVQGFTGSCEVDLPIQCTYDFDVTASKYLHALAEGAVPLVLLFSGTVFTKGSKGFGVEQVPWDREARYELPVQVWRDLMDTYFPNSGWLRLDRDTVTALAKYKAERGLTSFEEAVSALLDGSQFDGGRLDGATLDGGRLDGAQLDGATERSHDHA